MEIDRSHNTIYLDHAIVVGLVQNAFPNCQNVSNLKSLKGGTRNTLYSFKIGDDTFVLRLYINKPSACKTEKEIHALVKSRIDVPELIYSNETHKPWPYAIFKFSPGVHLSLAPPNRSYPISVKLGEILAHIHSIKFPKAGLFGDGIKIDKPFKLGSSPYLEETISILSKKDNARTRLGDPLADEILSFVDKHRAFFPVIGDSASLTHSDFKPINLIYQPGGSIVVLDWELAHAGSGILDFAVLLRHHKKIPLDMNTLVESYKNQGGVLPEEWFHSAMVTDFATIVTQLNNPNEIPTQFEELENTLRTTMKQWNKN